MSIATRYDYVKEQVAAAARACGRDPKDVRVIAVSKTVDAAGVAQAVRAGAHDFGENRPDCLLEKAAVHPDETWHFIGNIQSRRIDDIVRTADFVHSLYQPHHVPHFERAAAAANRTIDVLIEVNVSGEQSKSGCSPDDAAAIVAQACACEHLRVRGLMTMAPQGDAARARECFEGLARLRDNIRAGLAPDAAVAFNELSMGMSEDWREAVQAGATMVRIGRAIFDDAFEPPTVRA